jgi:Ca2+-binding EF-hand superfamily protein
MVLNQRATSAGARLAWNRPHIVSLASWWAVKEPVGPAQANAQPMEDTVIGNRRPSFTILALAVLVAGALVLVAALPVAAQDATPALRLDPLARLIKLVDKDDDGFISAAEAQSFAGAHFDKLDVEHKGYLTLEKFEAPLRRAIDRASEARRPRLEKALPRAEAAFKAINKAGDGRLTRAEFLADSGARFIAADTDKDGKLSLDELRRAHGPAF